MLANPSSTATVSGRVEFFDDDGFPLPIGIADAGGALQADFFLAQQESGVEFSVASLDAVTISTDGQGELAVGSAVVASDNLLGGVVRFTIPGIGIAGVGASPPLSGFVVPVRREAGGINTGVAIQNAENQTVTLELTLRNEQGVVVATQTIENFPATGHLARFIGGTEDALFPNVDTDDFQGTLVVEVAGGKVAATALELGPLPGQFTTLPVTPLEVGL